MSPRQLALDLAFRPAQGREDFLVSTANETAVAWLDRWPDWPSHGLVLLGPAASGKSHLAAVWRERSGAELLSDAPGAAAETGGAKHVLLDDADRFLGGQADRQEALFHLYNRLRETGGTLLLTARVPVASWNVGLPDLASRLGALPSAAIAPPDDALLAALLVKQFADRRIQAGHEVIEYLLKRIDRSFDGVRKAVEQVDRHALARKRRVTVRLAAELFGHGVADSAEGEGP